MRAARAGLVGLALGFSLLAAPAPQAAAHGDDPLLQVRLDSVEGAPDDVTVQVQTSVSEQMVVSNPSSTPLKVLDPSGRPFVKVSREGVRVDVRNPFFFRTLGPPDAPVAPPPGATGGSKGADSASQWRLVTNESSWGWFDPRLHPADTAEGTGVVAGWEIPLAYGSEPLEARGSLVREPMLGSWVPGRVEAPTDLTVQLLPGKRPAVALTRGAADTVVVLDDAGQPMLRLDDDGVALDPLSDAGLTTSAPPQAIAGGDRLVPVGGGSFHAWLDTRVQPVNGAPSDPTQVSAQGWEIPVLVDGERVTVSGEWLWQPADAALSSAAETPHGGSSMPMTMTGIVLALGLAGAVGLRLATRRTTLRSAPLSLADTELRSVHGPR